MIKIITDSTSDIDLELAKELNVEIVPLNVIIDGTEYKDRVDLQPNQFYELLQDSSVLPTTSQPSPQDYLTLYEEAKKNKDSVIVLTLSSVISGTYQSANIAADLAEYDDIHVIDTLSATLGLRLLAHKAVELRDQGKSVKEIVDCIEEAKHRVQILATVDTLEYFYKGGRLSRTAAAAGTLLKLKPIVGLKDGAVSMFGKARGASKTTAKVIELIHEFGGLDTNEAVCIGYTGGAIGVDKFEEGLKEEFGFTKITHGIIGPVVGTHAGPGAKGLAYFRKAV